MDLLQSGRKFFFKSAKYYPQNRQLFWNLKYLLSNDQYDGIKLADFDQNFFGWYLDTYVLANAIKCLSAMFRPRNIKYFQILAQIGDFCIKYAYFALYFI